MSEVVRLGVVGAGSISIRGLLPHLSQDDVQDRVRLSAVCDPVPGRAEAAAARFGVEGLECKLRVAAREHEILALPHDAPDAVPGRFRIEGKRLGRPQQRGFVDLHVAGRPTAPDQHLQRLCAALRRQAMRDKEPLHAAERFLGGRHQAHVHGPIGLCPHVRGIQVR